jgi:hypothetical protein
VVLVPLVMAVTGTTRTARRRSLAIVEKGDELDDDKRAFKHCFYHHYVKVVNQTTGKSETQRWCVGDGNSGHWIFVKGAGPDGAEQFCGGESIEAAISNTVDRDALLAALKARYDADKSHSAPGSVQFLYEFCSSSDNWLVSQGMHVTSVQSAAGDASDRDWHFNVFLFPTEAEQKKMTDDQRRNGVRADWHVYYIIPKGFWTRDHAQKCAEFQVNKAGILQKVCEKVKRKNADGSFAYAADGKVRTASRCLSSSHGVLLSTSTIPALARLAIRVAACTTTARACLPASAPRRA